MDTEQTFTLRQFKNVKDSRNRILKKYEQVKEKFTDLQKEHDVLLSQVNYREQSKLKESEQKNKKLQVQINSLKFQLEEKNHHNKRCSEIMKSVLEENKKLKEQSDGIMNDEGSQHILGCNPYEKFCQAMCELNHDEEFITELKEENKKLKEEKDEYLNLYKEKTKELVRLVPRTKRGLDPR